MAALGALIAAAEVVEHLPAHARCHLEQMKARLHDMDQLCGLPLPPAPPGTTRLAWLLHPAGAGRLPGPGPGSLRFVICDDHQMFAESLSCILRARGHDVVACTSDPGAAIAEVAAHRPDILLMDLAFPNADGVDALRAALSASPATRAVVLSRSANADWFADARTAGAAACLAKHGDMDDILDAIDAVATGQQIFDLPAQPAPADRSDEDGRLRYLTERERQVLEQLVGGKRTSTIAAEMGLALSTTRTHIQSMLYKLGAHSRLEAVAIAVAAGAEAPRPCQQSARYTPFGGGDVRGRREG